MHQLKDKNLAIDVQNALLPMQIISSGAKTKTGVFEPVKIGINKQKGGSLGSANPVWLGNRDDVGIWSVERGGIFFFHSHKY